MKKGKELIALKKYNDAEVYFNKILTKLKSAEVYLLLGIAQFEQKKYTEAAKSLSQSYSLTKNNKTTVKLLIYSLINLNQDLEAIDLIRKHLDYNDDDFMLKTLLVEIYLKLKKFQEAKMVIDEIISKNTLDPGLTLNKIAVEIYLKNYKEALSFAKIGIEKFPKDTRIISNYAALLNTIGKKEEALKYYEKLISLEPKNITAHYNSAIINRDFGEDDLAIKHLQEVLKINPNEINSLILLMNSSLKNYYWENHKDNYEKIYNSNFNDLKVSPFHIISITDNANKLFLATSKYEQSLRKYTNHLDTSYILNKRIKIAYISSDFRNHPISFLISELIEKHNKEKFEIHAVSLCEPKNYDEYSERIKNACCTFIDISSKTDAEAVDYLRKQNYDFAFDLNGHTKGNRLDLFRNRISRNQINFIGFPGSMGGSAHDYIIGDSTLIPIELEKYYSEKIINIPNCFQPIDTRKTIKNLKLSRDHYGIPNESFVFCCFNASFKLNPEIFTDWCKILNKSPNSILWILSGGATANQRILNFAKNLNIDPSRIYFKDKSSYDEYLMQFTLSDLFLDTLPFNAGTTASDALWMGLPLIARSGEYFSGRMTTSLLSDMDLKELITNNREDYINLAVKLSIDQNHYRKIKNKLIDHISNNKCTRMRDYTINFENLLENIYLNKKDEVK